ncbi:DUF6152 family protein [Tsuneonella sp. HG222]
MSLSSKTPALKTLALAVGPIAALALPAAALAHHGWGWTEESESRLTGTIKSISFGNPHMHLQVEAPNGLWEVDLSPPIQARASGFGPGAAKTGDKVVLTGHRARDRDVRGFKGETITVGGKTYDVYPQREKSLKP